MVKAGCVLEPLTFDGIYINKYLAAMENLRVNTYRTAKTNLSLFPVYVQDVYHTNVDTILKQVKSNKRDRYDLLAGYVTYAKRQHKSDERTRDLVNAARSLLEYHGLELSPRQFRLRVRLPNPIKRARRPLAKNLISDILLTANNIELKTCLMMLAATGMRPIEAFSIRHREIDLESKPARVYIRGEFTKTGVERYVFLTTELVKQLKGYMAYKTRERRITYDDAKLGHKKMITVKGELRPEDLLFGIYHRDEKYIAVKPTSLYIKYVMDFNQLLDGMGKGEKVNPSYKKSWRQITFYSFRRYVKTALSNAGFRDFGEWFIGHAGSPYWAETDEAKTEIFRKVEQYLTFTDVNVLEAKGADHQTKIEELQAQVDNERKTAKEGISTMALYLVAEENSNDSTLPEGERLAWQQKKRELSKSLWRMAGTITTAGLPTG